MAGQDAVAEATELCETISYYLQLRSAAQLHHSSIKIPAEVEQIAQQIQTLPKPENQQWAVLASGKLPKGKAKAAATDENGDAAPRTRGKWTEDHKKEMVLLIEDPAERAKTLGDEDRPGTINWAALARRYGFSGPEPIRRMYHQMTGKDAPGTKKKEAPEGEPPAKKTKTEAAATKASAHTTSGAAATSDGWTKAQCDDLIKLVEDEKYRKQQTSKSKFKWSRVAKYLQKEHKKDCKRKYTELTGKTKDE
jgi:hypothetical protein